MVEYHQRTKHHFSGYARGPETIDWDRQPDPFRRFEGTELVQLPLVGIDSPLDSGDLPDTGLDQAIETSLDGSPAAVSLVRVALMLEYSLALSAWKQYGGSRWSLRVNPSSGNLHPTEAYLLLTGIEGLQPGLYHYRADCHSLELRCHLPSLADDGPQLLIGLSSVSWRESWKYGERGWRYCQLDVGHAQAALSYGAALNGWRLQPLLVDDGMLNHLLGTDRNEEFIASEREEADCLLRIIPSDVCEGDALSPASWLSALAKGQWYGKAAVLDHRHFYKWPVIQQAEFLGRLPAVDLEVFRKTAEVSAVARAGAQWPQPISGRYRDKLPQAIRQRRSAQAFDGETSLAAEDFFVLLDHLLPRLHSRPWQALPLAGHLHLALFVHRVDGLAPGLYALPRSAAGESAMRSCLRQEFLWQSVAGAPEHLPLYLLLQAKAERTAGKLSCHQPIAAQSAFSLAMLAEFDHVEVQPWRYREGMREAGALGQQLYLEAEAIGLRGTGIGCFFDDAVHELLGISDERLQSFYHFTVGGPKQDARIVTLPPYGRRSA
ncbi:nitroreductase [Pseudomaricurvus sp. HS19]|nr:nitroreductase [Pseudomaricurvus sp. HS19]